MKKETTGKKGKILWIVLGVVLVLAIAGGVVAALLLGGQEATTGGRPALYWNVDRAVNVDKDTGLSTRTPAADGKYYIRFAYEGEQIELAVADKKLVNYIDGQDLAHLVLDKDGVVVDVLPPLAVASEIGAALYVQNVEGDVINANSSVAMNGKKVKIKLDAGTTVYNVSGKGNFVGEPLDLEELNTMDTIAVYGTFVPEGSGETSVVTHIFVTSKPVESPVYWRADVYYDSSNKVTARVPDENGAYTIKWFVDGETVDLKCKDKELVTGIDKADYHWMHTGLEFDKDGYIVALVNSALGSRTLLQCERFDITETYDDGSYVATSLIKNNGSYVQGKVGPECKIYDVSKSARAEGQVNRQIDSLRVGDRVCIWTDTNGSPVLIYVSNRMVDSPAYWNVTRMYDSTNKLSTRTPNAQGLYEVELLRVGDTKNTIYYAKDIETATRIDEPADRCVGLKLSEGNIIEYVYDAEAVFGHTYLCSGYFVVDVVGSVCTLLSPAGSGFSRNAVTSADCKVINVSTYGEYGAEVTLQYGDVVVAYRAPNGEIAHMFMTRRLTGLDSMYYRLSSRKYDSVAMVSTREPDADGYYVYEFTNKGVTKSLKTKDKKIADMIDTASRADMVLEVKGDIILKVHDYTYALGGITNSGYIVQSIKGDEVVMRSKAGKEYTVTLADYCAIYNVSTSIMDHKGEKTNLRIGDTINVYRDVNFEVGHIYITGRRTNKVAWPASRQYTERTPDADGWYYIDLLVDGKVSTYKTKNKLVITAADAYTSAFGVLVSGDELIHTSTTSYQQDIYGTGVTDYTISAVRKNGATALYTLGHATNTGITKDIEFAPNVKIYDVSDRKSPNFGQTTTLQVGDVVRTYTNIDDRNQTRYIFVVGRCDREGGYQSYCEHCDKVVYWNALPTATAMVYYDCHYYLSKDTEVYAQLRVYTPDRDYEIVLDLNGHSIYRMDGRVAAVSNDEKLTIMDSVGGGQMKSYNSTGYGATMTISAGCTVNMLGGTITAGNTNGSYTTKGGVILCGGTFNMYDGEIKDGVVQSNASRSGTGGCVEVSGGQFNMYDGKVSGGVVRGHYEKPVVDEAGNPVIDETTGLQKTETAVTTTYGGNFSVSGADAQVNIYGGTIENGRASRGGNFYVSGGTVTLYSGLITGGMADSSLGYSTDGRGGNFFVSGSSNIYLKGGVVTDGKAPEGSGNGGNIMMSSFKAMLHVMDGALVTNGQAKSGSNVSLMYSHMTVSGGKLALGDATVNSVVTNGTASGGYSTITMTGGTIEGTVLLYGSTTDDATQKYPDHRAIMTISGGTVDAIDANRVQNMAISGKPVIKNMTLGAGVLVEVDKMESGADVTIDTMGVFSKPTQNATNYTGYFHAVAQDYLTGVTSEGELKFYHPDARTSVCDHCDENVDWMPWDGNTVVSGHFYLTEDTQLTAELSVESGVDFVIDLAGYKMIAAADSRVFYIKGHGTLNVCDSSAAETGAITGGKFEGRGGNLYVESNGEFNLYSGTVTGGTTEGATSNGRGGNIFATGNVNLYGGTVSNGVALTGHGMGANIMMTSGTLTVYEDATIIGGQGISGSNVYLMYADLVNYGQIICNDAEGDNIRVASMANRRASTITMEAGKIDGVIQVSSGVPAAGVEDFRGIVTVNGGEIGTLNVIDAYADVIAFNGAPKIGKLIMTEGILVDTTGMTTGASVTVASAGVITDRLTDANTVLGYFEAATGFQISVNADDKIEVVGDGSGSTPGGNPTPSGEYCAHCDTNVEWTAWDGAEFAESGHYYLTSDLTSAGEIKIASGLDIVLDLKGFSLTAAAGERNFEVVGKLNIQDSSSEGTGKLIGSTISGKHGGNIYVNKGTFNLYSGTVTGGAISDTYYGGNLFVTGSNGKVNLYGGVVSNGSAARGGNIYISGTSVTISGNAQVLDGEAVGTGSYGRGGNIYITGTASSMVVSDSAVIASGNAGGAGGNVYCMYGNMEFKDDVQVKDGTDPINRGNLNIGGSGNNGSTLIISGGTFSNGASNLSGSGAAATVATISGGVFEDLFEAMTGTVLSISGDPVFENLKLGAGVLIDVGTMTSDASVKVDAADVVITDVLTNANDVVDYFDTVALDRTVIVNGESKLEIAEACACGCKTLASEVVWQDLNAFIKNEGGTPNKKMTGNAHYRLSANLNVVEIFGEGMQLQVDSDSNITIDLNGYTLYNENRIYVLVGGVLTVVDTSTEGTGILSTKGDDSTGTAGRAFYLKGTLNLRSGTIALAENAFVSHQALINLGDANAVFNMYGGAVVGGKAQTNMGDSTANLGVGGNIYARVGTVNIYGGTVSGGTATSLTVGETTYEGLGGNIYVTNAGQLNIFGGTVTGGTAAKGADVYLVTNSTSGGTLNISGGVIAGEVYASGTNATINVSGTANIGNAHLQGDAVITVGELQTGALIGVTKNGDITGVLEDAESYLAYFVSATNDYLIEVTADNKLTLVSNNACPCGCGAEKDQITWVDPAEYFNPNHSATFLRITENVHFRLENDFDLVTFFGETHQIMYGANDTTPADVAIDLNGHTWSGHTRMYVYAMSTLTIMDSSTQKTGQILSLGEGSTGGVIYTAGTVNLLSGTLALSDQSAGHSKGGVVYMYSGIFNMKGGSIINGRVSGNGGNVWIQSGTFNMYAGTISGGSAASGDNVYITKNGTLNHIGGTIADKENTVFQAQ